MTKPNIDIELKMIKDLFDIELSPTIKGDEFKGYNKGKFYLDSTNCFELAQAFLKMSHYLEFSHPNYNHEKGLKYDAETLFPTLKVAEKCMESPNKKLSCIDCHVNTECPGFEFCPYMKNNHNK